MTLRTQAVEEQVWTITPRGRVHPPPARAVEAALNELGAAGRSRVAVDLTDVVDMASAGLASLLTGVRRARLLKSAARLATVSDHVPEAFEMSGFDLVFTSIATDAEAAAIYRIRAAPL